MAEAAKQLFYFALIIYLVIILGRSIYKNYSINQKISGLEDEIIALRLDNENIKNLLLYYNTDSFKELEIRRRLGMQKPDEKVAVFEEAKLGGENNSEEAMALSSTSTTQKTEPNYLKWIHYLAGKK